MQRFRRMAPAGHGRAGTTGSGDQVANELAGLPEITQRLLALHVSDGVGRCRACTTPGTGVPAAAWPCVLHYYATAAEQIRSHRVERGRR